MAQDIQPTSEAYHPRDVVFINTHLIQRAMEGTDRYKTVGKRRLRSEALSVHNGRQVFFAAPGIPPA